MRQASFQYSIRTLFLVLAVSALIVCVSSSDMRIRPEQVIDSPVVLLYGAFGVLALTALGDVVGNTVGAILGTTIGVATWLSMLYYLHLDFPIEQSRQSLIIHALVAGITGSCIITSILTSRRRDAQDDGEVETVSRLLAIKKKAPQEGAGNGRK